MVAPFVLFNTPMLTDYETICRAKGIAVRRGGDTFKWPTRGTCGRRCARRAQLVAAIAEWAKRGRRR